MTEENKKYFHHLITGEIVFRHKKDPEEAAASMRINGIIMDEKADLPVRLLGKAQQILQLNFHNRMQDENIQILDVIIYSFTLLGYLTAEEFQAAPAGTKLQAKPVANQEEDDLESAIAEAQKQELPPVKE